MRYYATFILISMVSLCFGQTASYEIYDYDNNLITNPVFHENRVNLVILPDGYADNAGDLNQFKAQKDAFLHQLFEDEPVNAPFAQYRAYFNVFWVRVTNTSSRKGTIFSNPRIRAYRTARLEIDAVGRPDLVEADGESVGHTPAVFTVRQQALRMVIGKLPEPKEFPF